MSEHEPTLSIGELASRAGVSRRTVRFYVQRGLIPPPLGRGRGQHYRPSHLEALLRVKALQEEGATLEQILGRERGLPSRPAQAPPQAPPPAGGVQAVFQASRRPRAPHPGQLWLRQTVIPGFELHVQGADNALNEEQLAALARLLAEIRDEEA